MKKSYTKPQLVSRKVELGVFGDYGPNDRKGDGTGNHTVVPLPVRTLTNDDFRME